MSPRGNAQILVFSPRYADELAAALGESGLEGQIERQIEATDAAFRATEGRILVVDARGASDQGLAVARRLGGLVEARHGAMLVLLSRTDSAATDIAHDAGATSVLVSPFGKMALRNALLMSVRHADRLDEAVAAPRDGDEDPRRDRLTGLASGDQLQERIDGLLAADGAAPVFVITIGIGRIAAINAAYGRSIADQTLCAIAERLTEIAKADSVMASDVGEIGQEWLIARLAAAEFAVTALGSARMVDATRLADTIVAAFADPFRIDSHVLHLPAYIGIAANDDNTGNAPALDRHASAALIRQASAALASARQKDAGAIIVFRPDPGGDPLTRRADLIADLHNSLADGSVILLFQPQLALASGIITGVEALARWGHSRLGGLSAETLLETAEAAGLIVKLGRHLRRRAMADAANWDGALAGLHLSLNVGAADLADPGFVADIADSLAESGLAPERLILEVTEGALLDDTDAAAATLTRLHDLGVAIALDDFGTGFSSLAWMARLPIDRIKLDRSFMPGMVGSDRERLVITAIVALAHRLGLSVVGEGVEDDEQFAAARAVGCDFIQGYKVAVPMRAGRLAQFCADWSISRTAQILR